MTPASRHLPPTWPTPPALTLASAPASPQDGDEISIDAKSRAITMNVPEAELAKRKAAFVPPPLKATKGTLFKYIQRVQSASTGCVTDE